MRDKQTNKHSRNKGAKIKGIAGGGLNSLSPTPQDVEGPFFLEGAPETNKVFPRGASGTRLIVSGRLFALDEHGKPYLVPDALFEIWLANPGALYDIQIDPKLRQYRAKIRTNGKAKFKLETRVPGRYKDEKETRPSHLHFKFRIVGFKELTTQRYFPGDPFNATDRFYQPELLMVTRVRKTRHGVIIYATADFVLVEE